DKDERASVVQAILDGLHWQGRVFEISAVSGEGTQQLCYSLMQLIDEMKETEA
ncbi:essential GTPase, partial [Legionella brunensis]